MLDRLEERAIRSTIERKELARDRVKGEIIVLFYQVLIKAKKLNQLIEPVNLCHTVTVKWFTRFEMVNDKDWKITLCFEL